MTERKALEVLNSWLRVAYQNADGTDEASAELYEALQTVFASLPALKITKENTGQKCKASVMKLTAIRRILKDIKALLKSLKKILQKPNPKPSKSLRRG